MIIAASLVYELTNIQIEYGLIQSQELADEALSNYKGGKRLMYEYFTRLTHLNRDNLNLLRDLTQ